MQDLKDEDEKDEINVPIALSGFRDGDQGPSGRRRHACGEIIKQRAVTVFQPHN